MADGIRSYRYSSSSSRFAIFCTPRDMIEGNSSGATPVHEWLAAAADPVDAVHRYQEFMAAVVADRKLTDDTLRCMPCVTYDPYNDGICFIFKHENNGSTVLVGYGTPHVADDEIWSG